MANRQITIPDEINLKLRLEDNASFLITKLLIEHYKNTEISKSDLNKVKEQMIKEKEAKDASFNKELEKLDYELIKTKREKEATKQQQDVIKQKEEEKIKNIQSIAIDELGRALTKKELSEYLNNEYNNIFAYIDEIKSSADFEN